MPDAVALTIAVVGNPNTGKSTLFSALVGISQRTGNYPGVTVEKKIGRMEVQGRRIDLVDLPGTYSLAPRSPDEMVTVDVLLGRVADLPPVDAVLAIVDASNLERNLYLLSQVLELGIPVIIALNMVDVAERRGIKIDAEQLQQRLKLPVISIQAHKRIGLDRLRSVLSQIGSHEAREPVSPFPPEFQAEVERLQALLAQHGTKNAPHETNTWPRYLAERLLLDSTGYLQAGVWPAAREQVTTELTAARERLAAAGQQIPALEAIVRYRWAGEMLSGVVRHPAQRQLRWSDRADRLLTNRFFGTLFFALLMLVMFSAVFVAAVPFMNGIDRIMSGLAGLVEGVMPEGALRSLITDGVIGGVGSVLIFLPQIAILFFFIGILEDCGYMARAAYLMDRLMLFVGLSGKSFIPLLSSFACAIPGIMATRVIENRRDRLVTMLIAPLMSCSARLPVYAILIAAFIPNRKFLGGLIRLQGLTLFAMYLVGLLTALVVALILKRTLLRGDPPPFVMELPSYKWPSARVVLQRMFDRAWDFIARAGTVILAVAIVIWALSYYPHDPAGVPQELRDQVVELEQKIETTGDSDEQRRLEGQLADTQGEISGAYQRQSYLGKMGRAIEPAVEPLGWDWRIGCAVIASFPAREVVMGALGVIYNLGADVDVDAAPEDNRLIERLRDARWDDTQRRVYNVPVALSIMVFFALCAQCASTLAVLRRETNTWHWPVFAFVYMTGLAYVGALLTYQIGIRL